MRPIKLKLIPTRENTPPRTAVPIGQTIPAAKSPAATQVLEFMAYLARKHAITGDFLAKFASAESSGKEKKLRELWELTELSADAFADHVASFFKLPRFDLPQLLAASSQAGPFSRRFLSEMTRLPVPGRGRQRKYLGRCRSQRRSNHSCGRIRSWWASKSCRCVF